MTGAQLMIVGAMASIFAAFVAALLFGSALMELLKRYLSMRVDASAKDQDEKVSRLKRMLTQFTAFAKKTLAARRKVESSPRVPIRFRGRFYRSPEDAASLCNVHLSEVLPDLEYTSDGTSYADPWNTTLPEVALKHRYVRIKRFRKYRLCLSEYEGGFTRGQIVGNGERIPLDLIVPPGVNAEEDLYNEAVRVIQSSLS
jgi:hypothetical protein